MDAVLPPQVAGALEGSRKSVRRAGSEYCVRWARGELPVVELTATGFVVRAETPPPLRGYTDIFQGEERVLHGLAICSWARDGLVGYEFKRGAGPRQVHADHAPAPGRQMPVAPD